MKRHKDIIYREAAGREKLFLRADDNYVMAKENCVLKE
jgi:hypothetical protein